MGSFRVAAMNRDKDSANFCSVYMEQCENMLSARWKSFIKDSAMYKVTCHVGVECIETTQEKEYSEFGAS